MMNEIEELQTIKGQRKKKMKIYWTLKQNGTKPTHKKTKKKETKMHNKEKTKIIPNYIP